MCIFTPYLVWPNKHVNNAYGVSICLFYQLKHKYARIFRTHVSHELWCGENVCAHRICLDCIFPFYWIKRKNMLFRGVTCHFFRSENRHFLAPFFARPLWCHFYTFNTWIKFVIFRFEFAQESKIFWEMDIDDVQKRDRRNPFGKIRRALGVLRNFFGALYVRPYMQWQCSMCLKSHFW